MTLPPRARTALAVAALVALAVAARTVADGRAALAEGERALAARRPDAAVRHLERAAKAYLPGSPYPTRAYDHLEALAVASEVRGERARALAAWRAVRSSALATRWLVVPHAARRDRADRHLAALVAELPRGPGDRAVPTARLREAHLARLQDDRAPDPAWVVVMGVGLALWLGAAFWAARHALDDDERPHRRPLAVAGALVAFGLALFLAGLARA